MKRTVTVLMLIFVLVLSASPVAYANMAAPDEADIGSSVSFEKNDAISVLSEALDITVDGSKAAIVATYKMKNTSAEAVTTQSMFISPNIEENGVSVKINGNDTPFTSQSYALNYDTEVKTEDWRYVILNSYESGSSNERMIDTVTFELELLPDEECEVVVYYRYSLGGYPDSTFDAKRGEIEYYLTPAAMWKDFGGITITLYLDKDMPVITNSNLDFEKTGKYTYQYVSDTLPKENLKITIDENWIQNIASSLRSPYLRMTLKTVLPFVLLLLAVAVVIIVWRVRKKKKKNVPEE